MDDHESIDWFPDDDGRRTFETDFEGRTPSIAVVEAIAAIEGVEPTDVDFSLYESVDPDALDDLFTSRGTRVKSDADVVAEFEVEDYAVRIRDDGQITVYAPQDPQKSE